MLKTKLFPGLIMAFTAAIFFIPFLGNAHLFDWDEINFAEIAREMVVTHHYAAPQINYIPFTEKPPLFFWLQATCMNIFGVNEFSARLPNALLGVLVIPYLFFLGKKIKDARLGYLWSLTYFGSILPHLYFKSGIIDPYFNFFIFSGIFCLFTAASQKEQGRKNISALIAAGIFTGLGVLTKGPVALLITGLVIVILIIRNRFRFFLPFGQLLLWFGITLLTTAIWFGVNYFQNGTKFITEFTIRQWELFSKPDAGQKGFFLYHFVILFFGCFPASVFLVHAFTLKENKDGRLAAFKKWMSILFWTVLILFTVVTTKIVHYSSLAYYPLTFLAAFSLYRILYNGAEIKNWMKGLLVFSSLPFLAAPFALVYAGTHTAILKELLKKDPFALENLEASVHWTGWGMIPGILLLLLLLYVLFYGFRNNRKFSFFLLFGGTALYVQLSLFYFINRIEAYSQRANIEFWQSKAGQDAYYASYGYKTYTYYFYGKTEPRQDQRYTDKEWLFHGQLDKPLYISAKVTAVEKLKKEIPDAEFLYNKNGFYFFRRSPATR